jgi:hypothetical protein
MQMLQFKEDNWQKSQDDSSWTQEGYHKYDPQLPNTELQNQGWRETLRIHQRV